MSDTYHLLSYNVRRDTWGDGRNRWRRRRDRVAARVRPADVAGLQEVRWRMLRDLVFGAQFHPEKSGATGLRMLRNFLDVTADAAQARVAAGAGHVGETLMTSEGLMPNADDRQVI